MSRRRQIEGGRNLLLGDFTTTDSIIVGRRVGFVPPIGDKQTKEYDVEILAGSRGVWLGRLVGRTTIVRVNRRSAPRNREYIITEVEWWQEDCGHQCECKVAQQ